MLVNTAIVDTISKDLALSSVMATLSENAPMRIILDGKTGILLDESYYDGLLETLRILQENPTIVESLAERENDELIDEKDIWKYV